MKFLLFFQLDEARWAGLPEVERTQLWGEYSQLAQELSASGRSLGCSVLQPSSTATTLRLQDGQTVITDGPFAETKEVLAGYQTLECRDLDEALGIAGRFPPLRAGASVEIRPIVEGDPRLSF